MTSIVIKSDHIMVCQSPIGVAGVGPELQDSVSLTITVIDIGRVQICVRRRNVVGPIGVIISSFDIQLVHAYRTKLTSLNQLIGMPYTAGCTPKLLDC